MIQLMIQLITFDRYGEFLNQLAEMHRLRYRVFKQRLDWGVQTSSDMEVDEIRRPRTLLPAAEKRRRYDRRLCPAAADHGTTMLRDTFGVLWTAPLRPPVRASGKAAD